jgi:hypothetical protein
VAGTERAQAAGEVEVSELVAVVGEHALQAPSAALQVASDAAGERGGVRDGRAVGRRANEVGPGERAVGVDRGDLPDGAFGVGEAADEEAVDADQLAGPVGVDVRLRRGLARRLVGCAVARDQRQPSSPRRDPVAMQDLPHAVGRHRQRAPLRTGEHRRDPPRPKAGMPQRERHDPLLHDLRDLVGHLRPPALPRPEHLQPLTVDLRLPAVIGRAMHPERPARVADRRAPGEIEQPQAIAEQHVILRHAAPAPFTWR